MSEKEILLEKEIVKDKLNIIKLSLLDNEIFMPFNYNIFILWAIISSILFLTFEEILKINLFSSVFYVLTVIVCTFLLEYYLIKKENLKYNIKRYTKKQLFIEKLYMIVILFSIVLTYILVANNLIVYAYLVWIFMISLIHYVIGFILNNKYFQLISIINLIAVFIMIILINIYGTDIFNISMKYIAVVFLSFGLMYIGINSKKEYNFV